MNYHTTILDLLPSYDLGVLKIDSFEEFFVIFPQFLAFHDFSLHLLVEIFQLDRRLHELTGYEFYIIDGETTAW